MVPPAFPSLPNLVYHPLKAGLGVRPPFLLQRIEPRSVSHVSDLPALFEKASHARMALQSALLRPHSSMAAPTAAPPPRQHSQPAQSDIGRPNSPLLREPWSAARRPLSELVRGGHGDRADWSAPADHALGLHLGPPAVPNEESSGGRRPASTTAATSLGNLPRSASLVSIHPASDLARARD